MPSAATAKLEKQASTEAAEPIKQAIVIIEHKIRNLEKRKRKIESYRDEQKNGKELNADQLNAVSKYNEVLQTLEFAKDLCKQFNNIAVDASKQQKKQARKDALERAQQDCLKIRSILCIQDVLQNIGTESAREDFLAGRNGATSLTEEDLKYLDDIYHEVFPRRGNEEGLPPFEHQLTTAAEHLQGIVEGKAKDVVGTTYKHLKETIEAIHNCGYFDQNAEENAEELAPEVIDHLPAPEAADPASLPPTGDETTEEDENFIVESQTVLPSEPQPYPQGSVVPAQPQQQPQSVPPTVLPPAAQTPQVPAATGTAPAPAAQPTLVQAPPMASVPTPVAGVESSFFSTAAPAFVPNQPALPQSRALNEVISSVTGSFNFLQDSELDSPDLSVMLATSAGQNAPQHVVATPPPTTPVAVAPIPTQTFTNQNFASTSAQQKVVFQPPGEMAHHIPGFATATPNPPPPIPMPPSHQVPGAAQQRSVPVHQIAPAPAQAVPATQPAPQAAALHRPPLTPAAYGAPTPAGSAHTYAAQVQPGQIPHHHPHHHHHHQGAQPAQPPQPQQAPQQAGQPQTQAAQQNLPQSVAQSPSQQSVQQSPALQQVQAHPPAGQPPQIQASVNQSQGHVPQAASAAQPVAAQAVVGQGVVQPSQSVQSTSYAQKVDMPQTSDGSMSGGTAVDDSIEEWAGAEVGQGDWNQQSDAGTSEWAQQGNDEWGNTPQNDGYTTQGNNRNYTRTRGNNRGQRGSNGYGGRGRGNYQNGRGSGSGGTNSGYGYRSDGGSNYYQNGYQRENFGGFKRGRASRGAAGNAPRGMDRGGMRGMTRTNNRGVRPNFSRGGNKQ